MTTTIEFPVNPRTTDTQIAAYIARREYYPHGAPPEYCLRLCGMCSRLAALPEGGWPETREAVRQIRERFPRLSDRRARFIGEWFRELCASRDGAVRGAAHATRVAAAQALIDSDRRAVTILVRLVSSAVEANEWPRHDAWYVDVLRAAEPHMPAETAQAISLVAVGRVRKALVR